MALFERWLEETSSISHPDRPLVTISYAQFEDGTIALKQGEPTAISGPESLVYTHQLRAAHNAILVGVGTILSDDPQLNVRLAEGNDPRPVVLDSKLRIPMTSKVLKNHRRPWVFSGPYVSSNKEKALQEAGVRVEPIAETLGLLDLNEVLSSLRASGINSVMVEGGGQVIESFLRDGLADRAMITIAPGSPNGYKIDTGDLPNMTDMESEQVGQDKLLLGKLAGLQQ